MLPNKGPKGAPTFSLEQKLPKYPLPEIEETLTRYRRAAIPFCNSEEDVRHLDEQLASAREELVPIQRQLRERWHKMDNYVHGEWWSKYGYLEDRSPITPIESFPLHFGTDAMMELPSLPNLFLQGGLMVHNIARFHTLLAKEQFPVRGYAPDEPMSMEQYKSVFECCRIPGAEFDKQRRCFKTYAEASPRLQPRFFIVGSQGCFYRIFLDDPKSLEPLSAIQIAQAIQHAVKDSERFDSFDEFRDVGFLTGSQRHWWAEARDLIANADEKNAQNLDMIERSLFILTWDRSTPRTKEEHQMTLALTLDGGSRWFDKSTQITMFANGMHGFSFEHSVMDVASSLTMHEWCDVEFSRSIANLAQSWPASLAIDMETITSRIQWGIIPERVNRLWQIARDEYLGRANSFWKLKMCRFEGLGREFLREMKVSPDSFCQMVFQDSYFRLFKRIPSTYETVGVLRYRLARTETGRCASIESRAFAEFSSEVESTESDEKTLRVLGIKLRAACAYHESWMRAAMKGGGFDRHLFAVRCLCREEGIPVPAFLDDPIFARASKWDLSTSNAYLGGNLQKYQGGTSFRPVAADSIGVVYCIFPKHVDLTMFNVDAEFDCEAFMASVTSRFGLMSKALRFSLSEAKL